MKALKIVLGIVAALVVIFFALGMISPQVTYSTEIEVDKPLDESWAVYTDETKLTEWLEAVESIELQSGNQNEVGSTYLITIDQGGEKMTMTEEITAFQVNELMSMKFDNEAFGQTLDVHFKENEGKTIITTNAVMEGKGMVMRSIFAMMKGTMEDQDLKNMTNLKEVIEANTHNYFPEPEMEAAVIPEDGEVTEAAEGEESIQ